MAARAERSSSMIIEHATFDVGQRPAEQLEAAAADITSILSAAEGVEAVQVLRGVEDPDRWRLVIVWRELADHVVEFRKSIRSEQLAQVLLSIRRSAPIAHHFEEVSSWPAKETC
jgi:heme-degrading monooxygenase HmoA